jgi:hypothetical protein
VTARMPWPDLVMAVVALLVVLVPVVFVVVVFWP